MGEGGQPGSARAGMRATPAGTAASGDARAGARTDASSGLSEPPSGHTSDAARPAGCGIARSPERDACPACGSVEYRTLFSATDRLFRTTDRTFEVIECAVCGLVRLYPRPAPDELAAYYPGDYWYTPGRGLAGRLEQAYRRLVLRDHARFVRRAIRDAGVSGFVLDVGCGSGLLLSRLKPDGARVLGLETSPKAASIAWRANGIPCACGDLARAPFPDGSCSVVTMFHVLEHLAKPAEYVASAHRLLAQDGRLVVQSPNVACWQFLLLGELWRGLDVPRHLIDFRASDLEALLDSCGFEVVRRKHFSLRDNPSAFATSIAPGLDPALRPALAGRERPTLNLMKSVLYMALVAAAVPFSALEAACRAGATVMLEARKK